MEKIEETNTGLFNNTAKINKTTNEKDLKDILLDNNTSSADVLISITVCPKQCIDYSMGTAYIKNKHCIKCGACIKVCPVNAIEQK